MGYLCFFKLRFLKRYLHHLNHLQRFDRYRWFIRGLLFLCVSVAIIMVWNPLQKPEIHYYHWKTEYNPHANKEKSVPKYIKILDVTSENSVERSVIETRFVVPPAQKFTPVIYIENRLWFDIKDHYIERVEPALNQESLVKIIIDKITKIEHQYHSEIDTIQIDSDWNESTESLYFEFLRALKKQSHKKISVTIRLSQITYAKSMKQFARKGKRTAEEINSIYNVGVPPADKGMLMYYNMNNAFYTSTKNYVIDNVEGAKYMINFDKYPLKLDIGLPIYYQVSIIRFGEVIGFMQGISWKDVQNKDFNKIDESHVKVLKTQYFSGHLIYEGDILRMDGVTMNELKIATKLLKKALPTPEHIIFYEWSYRDQYDENQLKNLW